MLHKNSQCVLDASGNSESVFMQFLFVGLGGGIDNEMIYFQQDKLQNMGQAVQQNSSGGAGYGREKQFAIGDWEVRQREPILMKVCSRSKCRYFQTNCANSIRLALLKDLFQHSSNGVAPNVIQNTPIEINGHY